MAKPDVLAGKKNMPIAFLITHTLYYEGGRPLETPRSTWLQKEILHSSSDWVGNKEGIKKGT